VLCSCNGLHDEPVALSNRSPKKSLYGPKVHGLALVKLCFKRHHPGGSISTPEQRKLEDVGIDSRWPSYPSSVPFDR
jgi:hypothetical protein